MIFFPDNVKMLILTDSDSWRISTPGMKHSDIKYKIQENLILQTVN